jgi:hypothetical protein
MSDRGSDEERQLERIGEGEPVPGTDPEGGGGADREESFTRGGARGRDAEREEYYEPDDADR